MVCPRSVSPAASTHAASVVPAEPKVPHDGCGGGEISRHGQARHRLPELAGLDEEAGRPGFAYVVEQGGRLGGEDGETIASVVRRNFPDPDERQAALERAVLRLLAD